MSNVHSIKFHLRICFSIKLSILIKLSSRYLSQGLFYCHLLLLFAFRTLLGSSTFFSSTVVATLCQSSATFCKTRVRPRSESLCVCTLLQYISGQEQKKLSLQTFNSLLRRVPHKVSYGKPKKVYRMFIFCLLQYGITEWLLDIQNTGALTGEKFKKKFCSLKLARPPDEFGIFDTRPQDFLVVSDDLTTANMDPCIGWGLSRIQTLTTI